MAPCPCVACGPPAPPPPSCLLPSLPLTVPPTHSVGALGSPSPVPLHLSDGTSCIVLPPVVHRCLHLCLFSCLRLLSHPHLLSHPSLQVGCCVSQCLSLSLLSRFCAVPQPPPIIMPQPFVGPLDGTLIFHGRTHE